MGGGGGAGGCHWTRRLWRELREKGQDGALGTPNILRWSVFVPFLMLSLPLQDPCLKSRDPARPFKRYLLHKALKVCQPRYHPTRLASVFIN